MNKAIAWAKANPISVAAAAVAVLAVAAFVYVMLSAGSFTEQLSDRTARFSELSRLRSQSVEVPPEEADGRPEVIRPIAISQEVIDRMSTIYRRMTEEFTLVFERAQGINRPDRPMIVEDLFPNPNRTRDLPFTAREAYRRQFTAMLGAFVPGGNETRLNAGSPPEAQTIGAALAELEREFRRQYIGLTDAAEGGSLTEDQLEDLREEKRELLIDMIRQRAQDIHIYAETDPESAAFPFVRNQELLTITGAPSPSLLWEAQLELWIMQDIVDAIAELNEVDNPDASVAISPVKRLLALEVLPGYVGVHTKGAIAGGTLTTGGREAAAPMRFEDFGTPRDRDRERDEPESPREAEGVYERPSFTPPDNPDRRLPAAFAYTPSGRISNALYDVRHARLDVVVDFRRLPDVINAISHNNFMTVLQLELTDIDEFDALREGYFYGSGDCVRAEMVIETIWLRSWTTPLMPASVRNYLRIPEADD